MQDLGDPPTTARWLAWATAVLLVIGVVSAGVINIVGGDSDDGVVAAAGSTSGAFDSATTTTVPLSPTDPPARQPTGATSTTLPKAAAAVLKAIGGTAPPTTRAPATSTTAPPVTTSSTSTSTTSTTLRPRATVVIANQSGRDFDITVNGQTFRLAAGAVATVQLDIPSSLRGQAVGEPTCMVGATGDLFQSGRTYRANIVTGEDTCPRLTITP